MRARLLPTLALGLAIAPCGCFVDGSGGASGDARGDEGSSTGLVSSTTLPAATSDDGSGTTADPTSASTTEAEDASSSRGSGPDTDDSADASSTEASSTEASSSSSSSTGDALLTVDELSIGDLVITEMMGNPNCTMDDCEWFEVLNTTDLPIDLYGLGIGDIDSIDAQTPATHVLEHAILEPGALGVFARQALWPYDEAVEPLVRYPNSVALSNSQFDTIGLFGVGDILLDEAATFFGNDEPGRSRQLRNDAWNATDNDDSDNWCWATTPLPSTSITDDWGTPGLPNDC